MARPAWMENGRISEGGVPEKLGAGKFITRQDRLRHARKMGERRTLQEQLQKLKPYQLSTMQKKAGARRIV